MISIVTPSVEIFSTLFNDTRLVSMSGIEKADEKVGLPLCVFC